MESGNKTLPDTLVICNDDLILNSLTPLCDLECLQNGHGFKTCNQSWDLRQLAHGPRILNSLQLLTTGILDQPWMMWNWDTPQRVPTTWMRLTK